MDAAFINHLGDIACEMMRAGRTGPATIDDKSDGTPVTDLDRAIELALRREIEARHPTHGIIGEEFPPHRAESEFVWIIDPIDGTREFIQGLPLFGTLIALRHGERFIQGLAAQPLTGDRWVAMTGQGTLHNGIPVRTRPCASLSDARLSTMGYDGFCARYHAPLAGLRGEARDLVTADSFFVFGLLASGRVDAIVSAGFALHDYAALEVIVREAGGVMTDWAGGTLGGMSDGTIIAAGDPRLHAAILKRGVLFA